MIFIELFPRCLVAELYIYVYIKVLLFRRILFLARFNIKRILTLRSQRTPHRANA